jgi:hypothetical protein
MNTTERIVEAEKVINEFIEMSKAKRFYKIALSERECHLMVIYINHLRSSIASVIGQERVKIDLNEVEDMVQYIANRKSKLYSNNTFDEWATKLRSTIGYTLSDLTPKTKEDGE